ncbi:hypothetical protein GCM10010277_00480 [Streptomyces longisporoflavus]|uniref:hypothetical protein n=1 Tax=Streptomyces longisporoflavus TaxID=28044 RepID=UPI00167D4031|nr:hypothetical protein [Streptomyces longisporoflavus]GGV21833.1 hypothetical protein GCM10010277_00480 [Streptomyces longisporoflavus]
MTDARRLTPHETPHQSPHEAPYETAREPGLGSNTPREPGLGSGAPVHAPTPAPAPAPGPAQGSGGPAHGSGPVHANTPGAHATGAELLPQDERDKLSLRLQQALSTFVESPRQAVEEADSLYDDAVRHLTETLTERRRSLRTSWQDMDTEAHTEELRLALRQYRESMEQLLRV